CASDDEDAKIATATNAARSVPTERRRMSSPLKMRIRCKWTCLASLLSSSFRQLRFTDGGWLLEVEEFLDAFVPGAEAVVVGEGEKSLVEGGPVAVGEKELLAFLAEFVGS